MRKSIFAKYLVAFMSIILVSFTILTVIVTLMSMNSDEKKMEKVASNTANSLCEHIKNSERFADPNTFFDNYVTVGAFPEMIEIIGYNNENLLILVVDRNAKVISASDDSYVGKEISTKSQEIQDEFKDEVSYKTDLNGILNERHNVYTRQYFSEVNETVGETPTKKSVFTGLVLTCYVEESIFRLDDITASTIRAIIIAALWIALAAFVALYFVTEKIVSPLKKMTDATKAFSKGDFSQKIVIEGTDEIAHLAEQFNNMAESLANLEKMRSLFIANVSHDLRTPMTSISGFIDGMLDGAIPQEKYPHYLSIVSKEIKRLSRLVSSLLDISRIEAGARVFKKERFDICEIARLILISFENRIDEKQLNVDFDADYDKIPIISDRDAVHQILYNLCDNAVKFSNDGANYKIKLFIVDDKEVGVSIYNEGIGIPFEDQPHIFDRFYKTDKSRGLDKTGVGLGLYIVKTMVDNLNGRITLESKPGEYCKFTVYLPLPEQ